MFDDKLFASLELIGTVTGRSERCTEVIEHIKVWRDDLYERTKDIPQTSKPTVYAGAVSFRGGHGITGTSGEYPPFAAIGARNVVAEAGIKDFVSVDIEQIAVWDPDIVFLNPANMEMVEVDYSNHKAFFDNLSAVKNGQLYPQLPYNFNWSNLEIAIADTYYAGKIIFPEQFADIDPIEKADEIFTVMLGEPFYDNLSAVGYTFEQMTIGSGK
jgi:iron complex transport system substrate-binding protein